MSDAPSTMAELVRIAPLITGVALSAAALIALATLILYNRRQVKDTWVNGFREVYQKFWKDDDLALVRKQILNDNIYSDVGNIFKKRNAMSGCHVSYEEHEVLEEFDRFCAMLVMIKSFSTRRMSMDERDLWRSLLAGDYWVSRINRREAMAAYLKQHWNELNGRWY